MKCRALVENYIVTIYFIITSTWLFESASQTKKVQIEYKG
uniref:Uncharacterized protein n=1 Tax=Rhizophora mucronata TaxID=61149 RepID=A0A2P2IHA6_RHIMU